MQPSATRCPDGIFQDFVKRVAIEQSGQRIVMRHDIELMFKLALFADVVGKSGEDDVPIGHFL